MARRGYPVTVFESAAKSGGMLRYGIPSYRLPEDILDAEVQNILDLGVELKCGVKIGEDVSFEQLKSDYDVVYVAVGADVTILYRRTRNEMPAIAHEIDESEEEGIKLEILGAPVAIKEKDGSLE